jgi:hypothetical protein
MSIAADLPELTDEMREALRHLIREREDEQQDQTCPDR